MTCNRSISPFLKNCLLISAISDSLPYHSHIAGKPSQEQILEIARAEITQGLFLDACKAINYGRIEDLRQMVALLRHLSTARDSSSLLQSAKIDTDPLDTARLTTLGNFLYNWTHDPKNDREKVRFLLDFLSKSEHQLEFPYILKILSKD